MTSCVDYVQLLKTLRLTGTAITLGTHFLLASLNRLGAVLDGPAEQVLGPQSATWWILPVFAGIVLAWETTLDSGHCWATKGSSPVCLLDDGHSWVRRGASSPANDGCHRHPWGNFDASRSS